MIKESRKIAIFGGAFDPPHNVHIDIALSALREFAYDRIYFLPSGNPPHKTPAATSAERLDMLRLAIASEPKFAISTYEIDKNSIGYTAETLPKLKMIYGDFDFIIGGDSLRDMRKWYKPEKILSENSIVVAVRDGDIDSAKSTLTSFNRDIIKGVKFMSYVPRSLSSTNIRLAVQLGEDAGIYVPQNVNDYIRNKGVYDRYAYYRNQLKTQLDANRYAHTLGVVKTAIKLNEQYGLNYDKVFLSALLHDCAKCMNLHLLSDSIPADSIGTQVAHAFAGAVAASKEYGIKDKDILNAIYYHTTGRKNMTKLEKLIFTADMIEDGRDFEGVEELRVKTYENVDEGFKACLAHQYEFLVETKTPIYPLTTEAHEFYCK